MLLEDRLEVLLSTGGLPDATGADVQLVPLLDAAQQLAPLGVATPSPEFTDRLRELLLARVATLRTGNVVEEADTYGNAYTEPDVEIVRPIASQPVTVGGQRGHRATRSAGARWWQVVVAAMLCLLFGSVFFASRPRPSPADMVHVHLTYGDNALQSYDALVAAHADDAALADALTALLSEQQAATQGLSAVPPGSDHDALAAQLIDFKKRARTDLHATLIRLDWASRLRATAALGSLGEQVLVVSSARISRGDDDIPNAPWRMQVRGSDFSSGAILLFGGQAGGTVISVTPTQLTAEWTNGTPSRGVSIGVQNPDGTAAETTNVRFQSDDSSDTNATPSGTGTPNRHVGE